MTSMFDGAAAGAILAVWLIVLWRYGERSERAPDVTLAVALATVPTFMVATMWAIDTCASLGSLLLAWAAFTALAVGVLGSVALLAYAVAQIPAAFTDAVNRGVARAVRGMPAWVYYTGFVLLVSAVTALAASKPNPKCVVAPVQDTDTGAPT